MLGRDFAEMEETKSEEEEIENEEEGKDNTDSLKN